MKVLFKNKITIALSVIALFFALIIFINSAIFDVQLKPEVQDLEKISLSHSNLENNAYFAIVGITAATGKNITQTGQQLTHRFNTNKSKGLNHLSAEDFQQILGTTPQVDQQWKNRYEYCRSRIEYGCLKKMSNQILQTPINDQRTELMIDRYQQIIQMTTFSNVIQYTDQSVLPQYGTLLKLSQMKLAQLFISKQFGQFVSQVGLELKFWKMLLKQSTTIFDKMIAVAAINDNLYYLSEYINTQPVSSDEHLKIRQLLTPLTKAHLDISGAFISESETIFNQITALDSSFDIQSLLLQTQATKNLMYQYFTKPLVKASRLSTVGLIDFIQSESNQNRRKQVKSLLSLNPASLYNYHGKAYVTSHYCFSCTDYIARLHDVNNLVNLIKVQLSLNIQKLTASQEVINQLPIKDIYTNTPFQFVNSDNTDWLQFNCLDPTSTCRIKL